jgi:predicted glutamine amidotransferase
MCVIVAQEDRFAGWDKLENCFNNNPDGAGIMYHKDGKVVISKGYMNFKDFKLAVLRVPNYKNIPLVYHFRIASHGKVNPLNTHPFPYAANSNLHKRLDLKAPVGIAHNGIINSKSYDNKKQRELNITDTSQFLSEMYTADSELNKTGTKKFLLEKLTKENELSHSRFCIMDSKGITTIGDWFEIDGCKYSNAYSHLPRQRFTFNKKLGWVHEG